MLNESEERRNSGQNWLQYITQSKGISFQTKILAVPQYQPRQTDLPR